MPMTRLQCSIQKFFIERGWGGGGGGGGVKVNTTLVHLDPSSYNISCTNSEMGTD